MFKSRSKFGRLRAAVRQWMFPAEFRIAGADWPEEIADSLAALLARALATGDKGSEPPPPATSASKSSA